jgi:hypothetical protein
MPRLDSPSIRKTGRHAVKKNAGEKKRGRRFVRGPRFGKKTEFI